MTPDEMSVAIATEMGWEWHGHDNWPKDPSSPYWRRGSIRYSELQNYPGSLDACAEFEATMTVKELKKYAVHLKRLTKPPFGTPYYFDAWWAAFLRATPAQRCEAYLRLKGLWKQTH